jgi:hypothetical protein
MKRIALRLTVAILTLAVGVTSVFVLHRLYLRVKADRVKAEAIKLTNQFHEAAMKGDANTLDKLLADDFKGIGHTNMSLYTISKAEQLAATKAVGNSSEPKTGSITVTDANAREDGANIVVEGDATIRENGESDTRHFIYIFAERQGHLRLISSEYKDRDER